MSTPDQDNSNTSPGGTAGLVRSLNMQAVLEAVVEAGELSRPAAAERTGLSLPTAGSLIADLETLGLVGSKRQSAGAPGRPAALYSLNGHAGYVFAVDMGARKVTACVSDLHGSILVERVEATKRESSQAVIQQIAELHEDLISRANFSVSNIGIASIGIGGIVYNKQGIVKEVTNLPVLEGTRFRSEMAGSLGIRVILENDINLAAIGERWKGCARGIDDFAVISVGSGTGMGVVIGGDIYRGPSGAAGEIATLPIAAYPLDQASRHYEPFETVASGQGILRHRDAVLAEAGSTSLSRNSDVAEIFQAAVDGDEMAQKILDSEARSLAVGVAAVASLLDPEVVVFTGGIGSQEPLIAEIRRHVANLLPSPPPIAVSQLGNRGSIYGAVAIALQSARNQILAGTHRSSEVAAQW